MFIKRAGYDILFNGTLKFKHFLTGNRLTWNYYLKLRSSFGKASAYLRLYNDEELLAFAMHKKNSLKEAGSLLKFAAFHFKFLLFPYLFKNAQCANFIQQWSMRITSLVENKKIKILADAKIQRLKNEKLALKHEKNIC